MGRGGQGSSLTWMTIRIGLQGRKPGERNKLFDLFYRHRTLIRPIRLIRGKRRKATGPAPVLSVIRKRNEEDEETLADKSSTAHEHVHRTYHAGDRGPGHGARMGELYSLQPWTGRRARVYIPTDACGEQAERGLAWTDDTLDGQAWPGFLAGYTSVHQRGGCPEA